MTSNATLPGKAEIVKFEELLNVGPTRTPSFLGCRYQTYAEYKNDKRIKKKRRVAPDVIMFSIQAHSLLSKATLNKLYEERGLHELGSYDISPGITEDFSEYTGYGATYLPALIGRKYNTYSEYTNGRQEIPFYVAYSIQAHMLLPFVKLRKLANKRLEKNSFAKMNKKRFKAVEKKLGIVFVNDAHKALGITKEEYEAYKEGKVEVPLQMELTLRVLADAQPRRLFDEEGNLNRSLKSISGEFIDEIQVEGRISDAGMANLLCVTTTKLGAMKKEKKLNKHVRSCLFALSALSKQNLLKIKQIIEQDFLIGFV